MTAPTLPAPPGQDELLAAAHVVRIPLAVGFRGLMEREAVLLHGPAGWGEFAPFIEYGDPESARWLAAGIEAAWDGGLPPAVRDRVPVNATVPAVPAADVAGVALAAALPELPFACGLGTVSLLAADVAAEPLRPVDGALPVGRVAADAGRLAGLAAAPDRQAWWLDRLARCHALLAGVPA